MTTKKETMKDLTKIFIDLSKYSEKEIMNLERITNTKTEQIEVFPFLFWGGDEWDQAMRNDAYLNRTELTYPEFIKLFEGGEGENNGWIRVTDSLPNALQTVFISNGKGYTAIGCLVESEDGWHWAESNGVIYEENGEIISECESDDIEVNFWHPLPEPPKF